MILTNNRGAVSLLAWLGSLALASAAHAQITSPAGGEHIRPGDTYTIRWQADQEPNRPVGNLEISLWNGEARSWSVIAPSVPASLGSYRWQVPANLLGSMLRLRVRGLDADHRYRMSDGYFVADPSVQPRGVASAPAAGPAAIGVTLAPNPTSGAAVVTARGGTMRSVEVTDMRGGRMMMLVGEALKNGATLPSEGLAAGVYMVRVTLIDGTSLMKQWVVRH